MSSRVDILLATFNGASFLSQQIDSLLSQTYANWRLFISDDGSSDGTRELIETYASADDRITLLEFDLRAGGAKQNFYRLMAQSDADYFMFCDQDDVWLDCKIAKLLDEMETIAAEVGSQTPLLVVSDMRVVDEHLRVINPSFNRYSKLDPSRNDFRQVLAQSIAAGCSMMGNSALREKFMEAPLSDEMIMHDWWATPVAAAFGRIGVVSEALTLYRQHDGNMVGAVSYDPLRSAREIGSMEDRVLSAYRQATAFLEAYGDSLDENARTALCEFRSIFVAPHPVARVIALFKSGCWKKGVRKFGQIAVLLTAKWQVK